MTIIIPRLFQIQISKVWPDYIVAAVVLTKPILVENTSLPLSRVYIISFGFARGMHLNCLLYIIAHTNNNMHEKSTCLKEKNRYYNCGSNII